jgi:ABC-2 type transport system permease protein
MQHNNHFPQQNNPVLSQSQELPVYKRPSAFIQLFDIFLIELTNWRWSWRSMLFIGTIAPIFNIVALGIFARDSGRDVLAFVQAGNMVLSLMFSNMNNIQSHMLFMRFQGVLEYFGTLPIRKPLLVLSLVIAFLLISLPSLIVTIIFGSLILALPLHISPLILIVVPLCTVSLSGIGALIGSRARTNEEAGTISWLLTFLLMGLGPVLIPPQRLPAILLVLGHLNPATYAASAFRQVLIGPVTGELALDLGALTLFTLVLFWFVERKMDWHV